MLLDISDTGSQTCDHDRLISDFLGTGESSLVDLSHQNGSDLLSGFMIQSDINENLESSQDLMQIFQEHDDAARENKQDHC